MRELVRRLDGTSSVLASAIHGYGNEPLARRPGPTDWSPTEIICHLRDVDELFQIRFHTILALDDPRILVLGADPEDLASWGIGGRVHHPLDPSVWAEDRQYRRNDPGEALTAFRRRRNEIVALLSGLAAGQWERGGIHLRRGRLTLGQWVESLAAHDDNHVDQLRRALEGRP